MSHLISFYEVLSVFASPVNDVITDMRLEPGMNISGKTPQGWTDILVQNNPVRFNKNMEREFEDFISAQLHDTNWKSRMTSNREGIDMVIEMDDAEATNSDEVAGPLQSTRLRCKMVSSRAGASWVVVMRKIPKCMIPFGDTGLPKIVTSLIERDRGLVVVTGPTGAGKTTSLTSMIDYINTTRSGHIVTLEKPIEHVHMNKKSIITQREVPTDVPCFSQGLEEALRMTISAIVIGECMDRKTVETAFTAAESGHLVFISMHTSSAPEAISRLASFFDGHERTNKLNVIASVLNGVIAQALIPNTTGDGWVLASELLQNTPEVSKLILEDKLGLIEKQQSSFSSLNDSLLDLVKTGDISISEALKTSYNPRELRDVFARGVVSRKI